MLPSLLAHPEAAYFRALLSASIVFHTARHCALGKIPCYTANKTVMAMLNGETSIPFFGNITKKTSFCKFHFDEGVRVAKVLDIVDNFTFASLRSRRRISKKHDLIAHYHNNAVGRQVRAFQMWHQSSNHLFCISVRESDKS